MTSAQLVSRAALAALTALSTSSAVAADTETISASVLPFAVSASFHPFAKPPWEKNARWIDAGQSLPIGRLYPFVVNEETGW